MVPKFWNTLSTIGVKNEYDDVLKKRITLSNKFIFVGIIIFIFSGINNYLLGDLFSAVLIESLVLVCLLTFYLNKLYYHRFAISFFFIILSFAILYFDSYSGILSGTYLYYFPLILAIAFVFDIREDKKVMVLHFVLIFFLLIINVLTNHSLFRSDFLTDEKRHQMFMFNLPFSAAAVGFFTYLMGKNNLEESYLFKQRIKEQKLTEELIQKALKEKNILLAELHHRVKNNLAIISGLFNLKISNDLHIDAKNTLIESRNRVHSMAIIHNQLYKNNSLNDIDFNNYACELINEISKSYPSISDSIKIRTNIINTSLSINSAIPCGLILNELLTNCYKHAFKDKVDGCIDVSFENIKNDFKMVVRDNGIGLPVDYNAKQSLGVSVITALTEQLNGTSSFANNDGTYFELRFKNQIN
jgi:two-component sensor histidine kinase